MHIDSREMEQQQNYQRIIQAYPGEPRYLLAAMQDLQKEFNYLPRLGLKILAQHMDLPVSKVYATASFYKAFSLVPKGKVVFRVCDGTACHIKGSETLVDQLQKHLKIRPGETTQDGAFSLETVNCLGACALAPVMVVNGRVYGKVTPGSIEKIISEYGGQAYEQPTE